MQHWQDLVFFTGSWIFIISLIPTIRGKQKPEFSTSAITAIILVIFSISYLTLGLFLSAFATVGTATCWGILAYQRAKQSKK